MNSASNMPIDSQIDTQIDMSEWPVVVAGPFGNISDSDLKTFMDDFNTIIDAKNERFALVLDLKKMRDIDLTQRKIITDTVSKRKDRNEKLMAGWAVVFDSILLRGLLVAILWVCQPKYPIRVFNTKEDGIAWAKTMI